jgi:hypothetical protein
MVMASWVVFGLLAVLWTAGAWLAVEVTQWAADALASGTAAQVARDAAALPVPDWARLWIDPAWVQALQSMLSWSMDVAGAMLPTAGTAAGWLVPAIWVVWAVGIAMLLLAAGGVHALLRRVPRIIPRPAA